MQHIKYIVLAVFLLCMSNKSTAQSSIPQKIYLFGMSASFNDSIVYFTHIQELPDAYINTKSKFLENRGAYSDQLRNYLRTRGSQTPTCITCYAFDRKTIEKKYEKLRANYIDKANIPYEIRYVKDDEFHFTSVPIYVNTSETAAKGKKGK